MYHTNRKKIAVETGNIGEQIITEMFSDAIRSDNWYDSKKDGVLNDQTYEVKTFRLNYKTKGFWVEKSQWNKLDGVDIVFFLRIPESIDEDLRVYRCENHKECWEYAENNKGMILRSYPLTNCTLIGSINDDCSYTIFNNSVKNSIHKRFK
mgnify:CR=1 FL=1